VWVVVVVVPAAVRIEAKIVLLLEEEWNWVRMEVRLLA